MSQQLGKLKTYIRDQLMFTMENGRQPREGKNEAYYNVLEAIDDLIANDPQFPLPAASKPDESAMEILKDTFEYHKNVVKPNGGWATWEDVQKDGTVNMVLDAMEKYANKSASKPEQEAGLRSKEERLDIAQTIILSIDHYREAGKDDRFSADSIAEYLQRQFQPTSKEEDKK